MKMVVTALTAALMLMLALATTASAESSKLMQLAAADAKLASVPATHSRSFKQAASASIASVAPLGDGSWVATYTANYYDCDSDGFCGWYPYATQVPTGQPCIAADTSDLTWVGEVQTYSGTQTGTDIFYPDYPNFTLCVNVNGPFGRVNIGQASFSTSPATSAPAPAPAPAPAVWTPTAATPAVPVPTPAVTAPPTVNLTAGEARSTIRYAIRKGTHRKPRSVTYGCTRQSLVYFSCDSAWVDRKYVYAGTFDVSEDSDSYYWRFKGLRASHSCIGRYSTIRKGVRACARTVSF